MLPLTLPGAFIRIKAKYVMEGITMEDQNKEPVMGKINRILWYIMGVISFIVVLVVIFAMFWHRSSY